MSDFEKWLEDQDFYTNMRFIHGDKLFDRDGDVYRVLPVQMAYQAWDYRKAQLNNMEACYIEKKKQVEAVSHMLEGDLKYVEQDRRGNFDFLQMAMIRCLGDAIKALRGDND
ncbi:hypothetical protein [Acinetobacter sp. YH01025]|uniref:hypothetical protein n=1 Tax=Acinetobacter sp. YH01025 TaxID=2601038 RepID=UPI0015D239ED|nr:hypothetical protein [Acinetobacter sp. YH01025]